MDGRAARGAAGGGSTPPSVGGGAESATLESAMIHPGQELDGAVEPGGVEPLPLLGESDDDPFLLGGEEQGEAMGIGDDQQRGASGVRTTLDPALRDLTDAVVKLAESLRRRGEAGLHASPEMSRFEATLRAYCVGYLAGRRAEGDGHPRG